MPTFKLGPNAKSFYDPANGIGIKSQEVEVEFRFISKFMRNRIAGGHIVRVDKPTKKETPRDPLEDMTKSEIKAQFDYFTDEDKEKMESLNKKELIAFVRENEKEYE